MTIFDKPIAHTKVREKEIEEHEESLEGLEYALEKARIKLSNLLVPPYGSSIAYIAEVQNHLKRVKHLKHKIKEFKEKPKMKECILTVKEKKEIRDKMIKANPTKCKKEPIDLSCASWISLESTVDSLLRANPNITKEDLIIESETAYDYHDEWQEHFISYSVPIDPKALSEFIEQEEKRVLRQKKYDYEQYIKLKGQFE